MCSERPLIMTPMNAHNIATGYKDETRRLKGLEFINKSPNDWRFGGTYLMSGSIYYSFYRYGHYRDHKIEWRSTCPYGKIGDLLYLRENHVITADGSVIAQRNQTKESIKKHGKLRPSIHMKKEHSKVLMRIVNIYPQRLHGITPLSICAEGVDPPSKLTQWKDLWVSINGEANWNLNPWVWAIQFTVIINKPNHVD